MTSISPLPLLTNASPMSGGCAKVSSATSPSAMVLPVMSRCCAPSTTFAMSSGELIGIW